MEIQTVENITNMTRSSKNRIRFKAVPNILITMLLITIGATPILGYLVPNSVKLVIFLLWVITAFKVHQFTWKESGSGIVIWIGVYLFLQFAYSALGISREILFFLARCYIYVIPAVMVLMKNYYTFKEKKLVWYFFIAIFSVNLLSNIMIGLTEGEMAFRIDHDDANTNAGSTSFVVGCMLLIPILWITVRRSNNNILKLYSLVFIGGLIFYIAFLNTRATALIILLVIVVGYLLVEFSIKKMSKWGLVFRMSLVAVVTLLLLNPIMNLFSEFFSDSVRMTSRLDDLSFVLGGEGNVNQLGEGSLYTRRILWMASINTFFSSVPHFLFGVGDSVIETDFYSLLQHGVGNHSEFFDMAARYGMLGVFIYFFIIKNTVKFFNSLTDDMRIRDYLFVFLIGVLLFGFANNLSNNLTTMLMIYLLMPLTVTLIDNKQL